MALQLQCIYVINKTCASFVCFHLQLFLHVLLGGCGCLHSPQGLEPPLVRSPPVSALPGMWLPMTTARKAFGESSHGGRRTGAPSPGERGLQRWAEGERKQEKTAALNPLVCWIYRTKYTGGWVEEQVRKHAEEFNAITKNLLCPVTQNKLSSEKKLPH